MKKMLVKITAALLLIAACLNACAFADGTTDMISDWISGIGLGESAKEFGMGLGDAFIEDLMPDTYKSHVSAYVGTAVEDILHRGLASFMYGDGGTASRSVAIPELHTYEGTSTCSFSVTIENNMFTSPSAHVFLDGEDLGKATAGRAFTFDRTLANGTHLLTIEHISKYFSDSYELHIWFDITRDGTLKCKIKDHDVMRYFELTGTTGTSVQLR